MADPNTSHRIQNRQAHKPLSFIVNPNLNLDKQLIVLLCSVLVMAFIAQLAATLTSGAADPSATTAAIAETWASPNK